MGNMEDPAMNPPYWYYYYQIIIGIMSGGIE